MLTSTSTMNTTCSLMHKSYSAWTMYNTSHVNYLVPHKYKQPRQTSSPDSPFFSLSFFVFFLFSSISAFHFGLCFRICLRLVFLSKSICPLALIATEASSACAAEAPSTPLPQSFQPNGQTSREREGGRHPRGLWGPWEAWRGLAW